MKTEQASITLKSKNDLMRFELALPIRFGRAVVSNLEMAESREWLVTNGIGGYGSGTIAGSISRGYHGLLVAATNPPIDRRLMLVKLDETLTYNNQPYELGCNRWADDSIAPSGQLLIQSFELQGSVPCWRYACGDALLDKRIWMEYGQNTTYVSYTLVAGSGSASLSSKTVVDNRVFHNTGQINIPDSVNTDGTHAQINWKDPDSPSLILGLSSGKITAASDIFRNYQLTAEVYRGLRSADDHAHAATFNTTLSIGDTAVFVASTETNASPDIDALVRRWNRDEFLLSNARAKKQIHMAWKTKTKTTTTAKKSRFEPPPAINWVERLILAADQFIVSRPSPEQPNGMSVIAGYHWFEDWGRDTMIALPGLTLATGRPEIAAPILQTFARFVSKGMLPNRFPDGSDTPLYNTMDATLWYFQAIAQYYKATDNVNLVKSLFPVLETIITAHIQGTRYGIKVDPTDGLLQGGEPGTQLTWMDAKIGDNVITPRIGKPVEINALWYNALRTMEQFAKVLGEPSTSYTNLATQALEGFNRFWNKEKGYCYDVLDGPNGNDDTLRPNQLLAISLPDSPLQPIQQAQVVDACAETLLTSHGLRSLSLDASAYKGMYGGDQNSRDSAYHQGSVWGWLAGPFISAHLRVYKDTQAARRYLDPLIDTLCENGLGSISEIFDGNPPFTGRGCIAQAWSVGEVLRIVDQLESIEAAL